MCALKRDPSVLVLFSFFHSLSLSLSLCSFPLAYTFSPHLCLYFSLSFCLSRLLTNIMYSEIMSLDAPAIFFCAICHLNLICVCVCVCVGVCGCVCVCVSVSVCVHAYGRGGLCSNIFFRNRDRKNTRAL